MGKILRLPSITGQTDAEKIEQIRMYLFSTIRDIEWALNDLENNAGSIEAKETDATSMFALIKPLILQSSDIINSYYDIYKKRSDALYVPKTYEAIVGSIVAFAEGCKEGVTTISTSTDTTSLPEGYTHSVGVVHKLDGMIIINITEMSSGAMATKSYVNGAWGEWKKLIPE